MQLLYFFQSIRNPFLDFLFGTVTYAGDEIVFLAAAILLYWCVDKKAGYFLMSAGFCGTILNQFMKISFRIPRPWVLDPNFSIVESARAAATGYSFPSGHSTSVTTTMGSIGLWFKNKAVKTAAFVILFLVLISRMYLGVHTPLDVIVGFGLGALCLGLLYVLFKKIRNFDKAFYGIILAMLALAICHTVYTLLFPFPADVDPENLAHAQKNGWTMIGCTCGMLLGYWLDSKYIRFETGTARWWAQIPKAGIGLLLAVALKSLLKAPLLALCGGSSVESAIRYFIVVLFAAALWPMTFRFFARLGQKKAKPESP